MEKEFDCLWKEEDGVFELYKGSPIDLTIKEAKELAEERGELITFVHNGVTVTVKPDSSRELIYRAWNLVRKMDADIEVGPVVGLNFVQKVLDKMSERLDDLEIALDLKNLESEEES